MRVINRDSGVFVLLQLIGPKEKGPVPLLGLVNCLTDNNPKMGVFQQICSEHILEYNVELELVGF